MAPPSPLFVIGLVEIFSPEVQSFPLRFLFYTTPNIIGSENFKGIFHDRFVTLRAETRHFGVQARTMKIANPPRPPLEKGGWGGFESYFQRNRILISRLNREKKVTFSG